MFKFFQEVKFFTTCGKSMRSKDLLEHLRCWAAIKVVLTTGLKTVHLPLCVRTPRHTRINLSVQSGRILHSKMELSYLRCFRVVGGICLNSNST